MYDIVVIGAGAAGASFALKMAKYTKVLLVEANEKNYFPKGTKVFPQHNLGPGLRGLLRKSDIERSSWLLPIKYFHRINHLKRSSLKTSSRDQRAGRFRRVSAQAGS